VDVLCLGEGEDEQIGRGLEGFALGPLTFAFRPASQTWLDPCDQRRPFLAGRLTLLPSQAEAFAAAPRRLWIAARLIAEFALEPDPWLLERARAGCAERALDLPQGAPARRAMCRILAVPDPTAALAYMEEVGLTAVVAPGAQPLQARRLRDLPCEPALRWAVWLRGSATSRALVTFRVPHALARRIERVQSSHPLDRMEGHDREAGLRRLIHRLEPALIDGLLAWRRLELETATDRGAARQAQDRLTALETGLDRLRTRSSDEDRRRNLAIKGADVMQRLDAGPGPHVGAALAHLAEQVATDPASNTRERLEMLLDAWAERHIDDLPRPGSAQRDPIG
jgi:hypothetical protein